MDNETIETLRTLEESLWRSETRFDDALMDEIFADDFCEFGRSGRIYQRRDMMPNAMKHTEISATLPLKSFCVRALSDEIVQVTYVSEVLYGSEVEAANRSSIWKRSPRGWVLCFHQGTPTA